jgi:hypothetical protein
MVLSMITYSCVHIPEEHLLKPFYATARGRQPASIEWGNSARRSLGRKGHCGNFGCSERILQFGSENSRWVVLKPETGNEQGARLQWRGSFPHFCCPRPLNRGSLKRGYWHKEYTRNLPNKRDLSLISRCPFSRGVL